MAGRTPSRWDELADFLVFLLILELFFGWVPGLMCWAIAGTNHSAVTAYVGDGFIGLWGAIFLAVMIACRNDLCAPARHSAPAPNEARLFGGLTLPAKF